MTLGAHVENRSIVNACTRYPLTFTGRIQHFFIFYNALHPKKDFGCHYHAEPEESQVPFDEREPILDDTGNHVISISRVLGRLILFIRSKTARVLVSAATVLSASDILLDSSQDTGVAGPNPFRVNHPTETTTVNKSTDYGVRDMG